MDFIDDFIQEYRNNPCLWKADCINFKNRTKRQEAYIKLIDVAAKHGEHYNVERTKQKINNLRCAFRHQLKKYIEFKTKGETEEPYCPKRRYFESLMFLKDEESADKKLKHEVAYAEKIRNSTYEREVTMGNQESENLESENQNLPYICKPMETCNTIVNEVASHNQYNIYTTAKPLTRKEIQGIDFENCEQPIPISNEPVELYSAEKNNGESQIFDFEKESQIGQKKNSNYRKRSSSLSSQISTETEVISTKTAKADITSMDIEQLFTLACKSIQSNMDDHFSNFGKIIAHKLRSMEPTQAIFSEKIITDVLFQGQMKLLSASSINQFLRNDSPNKNTN